MALCQSDRIHQLMYPGLDRLFILQKPVFDDRFRDRLAHGFSGIQRGKRILENDLHLTPHLPHFGVTQRGNVGPVKEHFPVRRLQKAENRPSCR